MWQDGRIAVRLLSPGEAVNPSEQAVLIRVGPDCEGNTDQPGWAAVRTLPEAALRLHEAGCRCCGGRTGLADALALLFAQRARMQVPFFTRVVMEADPDRLHDLVTILRDDGTVSGRFRLES